jgi:hypothetical protein
MCILKKGDWLDDNIDCEIEVYKNHKGIKTAYGFIKTSKPLPIEDEISYFLSGEMFELWFEKAVEEADGLKIMLEDIDGKTKKSSRFKSMGPLFMKDKK